MGLESTDNIALTTRLANLELSVEALDKECRQLKSTAAVQADKLNELANMCVEVMAKNKELSCRLAAMVTSIAKLTATCQYLDNATKMSPHGPKAVNYSRRKRH